MNKIIVTPRSLSAAHHPALERLHAFGYEVVFPAPGRIPTESELLAAMPGCVGWLAGVEKVSSAVVHAARDLRVISRNGVGTDNLPVDLLASRGIIVRIAEGANTSGVAELALALMLAALRHIGFTDAGIKAGGWPRRSGSEIGGRTVSIIGFGAIGRMVARFVVGLGARVLAYDPILPQGPGISRVRFTSLAECLSRGDVISLHCPTPKDGRPIINDGTCKLMKDGAVLINTARAALIDENAILLALEAQKLSAYATDVFPHEPPISLNLARHERVIATSHIGGLTTESIERAANIAVDNLLVGLGHDNTSAH